MFHFWMLISSSSSPLFQLFVLSHPSLEEPVLQVMGRTLFEALMVNLLFTQARVRVHSSHVCTRLL